MARKAIQTSEVIKKGLLEEPKAQAEAMLGVVTNLTKEFQSLASVNLENLKVINLNTADGIKKATSELQKSKKIRTETQKLSKEELRLKEKLKSLETQEAKTKAATKVQILEKNKALKAEARNTLGLVGAYEKQSKTLIKLRKSYKDLIVQGKGNTAEAKRLSNQIGVLDKQLKNADASAGQFGRNVGNYPSSFSKAASAVKGFLVQMGLLIGVQQIFSKLISGSVALDEAFSDVRKTTGLTNDEVSKLNSSLETLNTRTSQVDLLGIATAGGRLGVANEELLGFTEVIDKVVVALGDELPGSAEDIATEIAKITQVFGEANGEGGIAGGINKVGSAINDLGAKTKAQSGFLVDFTKRLGGVAAALPISAAEVLGLGATFDELGLQAEVSSSAISQVLLKAATETEGFAAAAGLDVENFRNLLNTDANEALLQFSEGITKINPSATELASALADLKIKGVRANQTFLALSKNQEKLRENQKLANTAFREGTSLVDEFNIKNNTLGANLAKLGKIILSSIVNSGVVNTLRELSQVIVDNVDTIKTLIKLVVRLGAVFAAYRVGVLIDIARIRIMNAQLSIQSIRTKAVALAQRALNFVMRLNPIGLVIAAITALVLGFKAWYDSSERVRGAVAGLFSAMNKLKDNIVNGFSDIPKVIIKTFQEIPKAFINSFKGVGNVFKAIINGEFSSIPGLLAQLGKDLLKTNPLTGVAVNLGSKFGEGVGDAYADGFEKKMKEEAANKTKKTVKEQTKKIADELSKDKDFGGFKPVGENIADGIAEGFKKKADGLKDEINKIVEDIPVNLKPLGIEGSSFTAEKNAREDKERNGLLAGNASGEALRKTQEALDKEVAARKLAEEEKRKAIKQTTDAILEGINKRADLELERAREETTKKTNEISVQQARANAGLENTLEFAQKKQDEAELRERDLEDAKLRREKITAYFKILQSSVTDGNPETAPFKALATVVTAEAISQTLGGFAEGGFTGDGYGSPDSTGYKVAGVVHQNEYVVPEHVLHTETGQQMVNHLESMRLGNNISLPYTDLSPAQTVSIAQNSMVNTELKKIREAINNQTQLNISWDSHENRLERLEEGLLTRTKKYIKRKPRI